MQEPIFIVSTGRAGSKMIAKTLGQHQEIFAIHEPRPHLNPEAFTKWSNLRPDKRIKDSIKNKRANLIKQANDNKLVYLESSHYCSHLIPMLNELFGAKFIHLYRDGRNFVRSGLERDWYYQNGFKRSIKKLMYRNLRHRYFINMGWQWEDHRLKPPEEYQTRIEKISWLWVEINEVIINHLSKLPDKQYISVKLEEFDWDEINKILEFINVSIPSYEVKSKILKVAEEKPNKTTSRTVPPFDEWKSKNKSKFWSIAADMMRELQYS